MLHPSIYREIVKNPIWAPYVTTVDKFSQYLKSTEETTFRVSGVSDWQGEALTVTRELPYVHRWTPLYKSSVLARFYQLEDYLKENPVETVTMLTLTTYHSHDLHGRKSTISDATIPEAFTVLKKGWLKLSAVIRNLYKTPYVWILEPHRTGYPHIHVALLGKLTESAQNQIKRLWHRYGCGSLEEGANFSEKSGADSVKSIRNYLMKYMVKAWKDTTWTTAQLVFNALVWQKHWRLWGCTKDITAVMKRAAPEKTGIDWQRTEIKRTNHVKSPSGRAFKYAEYLTTWQKEGTELEPEPNVLTAAYAYQ